MRPLREGRRRDRFIAGVTFEHKYVNADSSYLRRKDQTAAKGAADRGRRLPFWVTPKTDVRAWRGCSATTTSSPTRRRRQQRERVIGGVAYWPRARRASAGAPARLRAVKYRFRAVARRPRTGSRCTRWSTSNAGRSTSQEADMQVLRQRRCARRRSTSPSRRRRRPPRRRSRSTAPARRSRIRSTRSGSPSTTSCTRTCRSTTSRSVRAAASGSSRTRRSSSAPPTDR